MQTTPDDLLICCINQPTNESANQLPN